MEQWIKQHIWSFAMVIFMGGALYTQVENNKTELEKASISATQLALMDARMVNVEKALGEMLSNSNAQNKEFLEKLDAVIIRLDQRDAAQSKVVNGMLIDVSILKERVNRVID